MRELARIKRIVNKLKKIWDKYPDMRFFQFIMFIAEYLPEDCVGTDLFFLEDDIFEKVLDKLVETL